MWWFIAKTLLKLYIADSVFSKTTDLIWGNRQNLLYWLDEQMREFNKLYNQKLISQ